MDLTFTDEEYEQMAIKMIIGYKNKDYTDDEVRKEYSLVIKLIVDNIKKSASLDKNIKQKTQGARSVTYRDDDYSVFDDVIKGLLGTQYVRMF